MYVNGGAGLRLGRQTQNGSTALMFAAWGPHGTDSMRLLLEAGANMDAKDKVRFMRIVVFVFCVRYAFIFWIFPFACFFLSRPSSDESVIFFECGT